jgi:hypothetical protein
MYLSCYVNNYDAMAEEKLTFSRRNEIFKGDKQRSSRAHFSTRRSTRAIFSPKRDAGLLLERESYDFVKKRSSNYEVSINASRTSSGKFYGLLDEGRRSTRFAILDPHFLLHSPLFIAVNENVSKSRLESQILSGTLRRTTQWCTLRQDFGKNTP